MLQACRSFKMSKQHLEFMSKHSSLVDMSIENSRTFSLQAFEELLQVIPIYSIPETSLKVSKSIDEIASTMENLSLCDSRSLVSRFHSFLHECSGSELLLEGCLAIAAASIDSQFWHCPSGSDGPGSDFSVQEIIACVVKECIGMMKAAGATSEKHAIPIPVLGRKLTDGIGVKLPKDQKLKSILQGVPGIVFIGDLASRSGSSVYFSDVTAASNGQLPSEAETSSSSSFTVQHLRESSDMAAAVYALLHLWCESPDTQSQFHKMCREMQASPKACMDAIQRTNALLRVLLQIDRTQQPESALVKGLNSTTFSGSHFDSSAPFKFAFHAGRQQLRDKAAAFSTKDAAAATSLRSIAAKHFSTQLFEIFSAFGQSKCRLLLPDGSSRPSSLPLKVSLQGFQSRVGFYMGVIASTDDACVGISCATCDPFIVNPFAPLHTEIIAAPALAIDRLQATYEGGLSSSPGCIVSRTSSMEISFYGPDVAVAAACASIRDALAAVISQLVAVPLVFGDEIGMIEANHRAVFGPGFQVASILSPDEFNTIQILNLGRYLVAETGRLHFERGCSMSDLKTAFKTFCLDKLFPLPFSENHPFDYDAKECDGQPMVTVSFMSCAAAKAACDIFSRLPNSSLLNVTQAAAALPKTNVNSAVRVTFEMSNITNFSGNKNGADAVAAAQAVKERNVAGCKYYAVNMKCCNKSAWHLDQSPIDPDRPPVEVDPDNFMRRSVQRYYPNGDINCPAYDRAVWEEHRHAIGRGAMKSAFTTHHALRRETVKMVGRSSLECDSASDLLWIPHEVFSHSGHKCFHSDTRYCPVVDGIHRRTCDGIPRWSCCNAPVVDGEDKGVFCNAKPREPFYSFTPADLCHFCWETHYFLSRSDAEEAAASAGAQEYLQMVAAFEEKNKAKEKKRAYQARQARWNRSDSKSDADIERFKGKSSINRYILGFSGQKFANEAIKHIKHDRHLEFSLEAPAPGRKPRFFSFTDVKNFDDYIAFNLRARYEDEGGKNIVINEAPLPNRNLLLGLLKHWGCEGITQLGVLPCAVAMTPAFVKASVRLAKKEIQDALSSLQVASSSGDRPQTEASAPRDDFCILSEQPVLDVFAITATPSFHGFYGWQMMSFVVQMRDQKSVQAATAAVQKAFSGQVKSLGCEQMCFDLTCCEICPDASKYVPLPPDANESFLKTLERKLKETVSTLTTSVLNWGIHSIGDVCDRSKSNRMRLALASSEEGLVDHVLRSIWCFVFGIRLVPSSSLTWWLHSQQGADFLTQLRAECDSLGVCVTVQSSGAVIFHGDYNASKVMHALLKNRLSEVEHENETSVEESIVVSLPQLKQFIKRHGSLRAAVSAFAPNVQNIRSVNTNGIWRLVVTASAEGIRSVRDNVLIAEAQVEAGCSGFRYQCPICDEGSDILNEDWLVSLTCGCILHVPCARLCYSCDESDPSDPLKSRRLAPLQCMMLDKSDKKCNKPLAQLDIAEIVQDPVQRQRRVTEELTRFASIPSNGWRVCPVPDESTKCKMLYRRVSSSQCWAARVCEGCGFEHCASCEGAPHAHGMSCVEAGGGMAAGEDPLANLDRRRCVELAGSFRRTGITNVMCRFGRCPKCEMLIERAEACPHMVCTRCDTHFHMEH
jgi:hypothetical protein